MSICLQAKRSPDITFEQFLDIISHHTCHKKTENCDWSEQAKNQFRKIYENKKFQKGNLQEIAKIIGEAIYAQSTQSFLWGDVAKRHFV